MDGSWWRILTKCGPLEKGMANRFSILALRTPRTEDEMVGWHHGLNGHEFEQAPGVGDGQGSLRAAVHGVTESDTTEKPN